MKGTRDPGKAKIVVLEHAQRRAERAQPTELLVQEARSTLNRFTGGGFNLNMPAS